MCTDLLVWCDFVSGDDDCYIYDSFATGIPDGSSYFYSGKKTFVEAKYVATSYFAYGPNRTVAAAPVQDFLDSSGWVRHTDGVIPFSADVSEVTHYAFDAYDEADCVEKCASIASCIAASVYNGRCYIYDSSVTSQPDGTSLFVEGASEVGHVLGQKNEVWGAVTFTPPLAIDDTFMDEWVFYEGALLYGSYNTYLNYYRIDDISLEHCRRWCAASEHCLGYAMYTAGMMTCVPQKFPFITLSCVY